MDNVIHECSFVFISGQELYPVCDRISKLPKWVYFLNTYYFRLSLTIAVTASVFIQFG